MNDHRNGTRTEGEEEKEVFPHDPEKKHDDKRPTEGSYYTALLD